MERNRRLFKKLFPADLYTAFIDVGHYNRDISRYKPLVAHINLLPQDAVDTIRENITELNQNRTPTHYIQDYAVFEHLGRGAFGSVYKVRKRGGQTFVALKEVWLAWLIDDLSHFDFNERMNERNVYFDLSITSSSSYTRKKSIA